MTSNQIRQSFLDFFSSKQHTIVPSSSLLPDSPNLLFTNAGMNQFVPIFLGQRSADVDRWPGAIAGLPTRAADTQKCIRAGGKHNDLEDVGLDTYHHTLFEMLGNWSFGDYFKKEAIEWAWELVTEIWKFPKNRLYATVYNPDKSKNDPAEFDQEAYDHWARLFSAAGLDPKVHIVFGNKKDNFWMMGDTGPCGPCSEIHVDLTPQGDTRGALVNQGDARCIEIWNLVFIQFNANPDGTFSPLPAKHVDTGMGFERVTGIMQCTKNFSDFSRIVSNYETDIFRPLFDQIEKLSGKKYGSTLSGEHTRPRVSQSAPSPIAEGDVQTSKRTSFDPEHSGPTAGAQSATREGACAPREAVAPLAQTEEEKMDVAFRVIADHIRTLSFAIADGIQPGNTDRNYVLRRILRRAVKYGRTLGFHEPFFYKLVDVLAETMGHVFSEIREKRKHVQDVIRVEEEAFNRTLDEGIRVFQALVDAQTTIAKNIPLITPKLGMFIQRVRELPDVMGIAQESLKADPTVMQTYQIISSAHEQLTDVYNKGKFLKGSKAGGVFQDLGELSLAFAEVIGPLIKMWETKSVEVFDQNRRKILAATPAFKSKVEAFAGRGSVLISGTVAFVLYDTYGFPLDLTELMARERGLTVDVVGFNRLMEEQRARARAAQKKEVISISQVETTTPTNFVGYDTLETPAKVLEVVGVKDKTGVILDTSVCYAEMGGQVGDTGELTDGGQLWRIANTQKAGNTWLHFIEDASATMRVEQATSLSRPATGRTERGEASENSNASEQTGSTPFPPGRLPGGTGESPVLPIVGSDVILTVDRDRRNAIQRHHTVTHLLHWALHEVVSKDAAQKGSYVGPEKLTFDFNSAPLTPQQVADIEKLVNERIVENAGVSWTEVPYAEIKACREIIQFFGEKYGEQVRVVQIGGEAKALNGYSMELCGGTHTRATGEIGLFRIVGESAIAAGIRRIEAVAGLCAYEKTKQEAELIGQLASRINSPVGELEKKIESLLAHQKELEKQLKAMQQKQAAEIARGLIAKAQTIPATDSCPQLQVIVENLGAADGDYLQAIADSLKGQFKGVVVLGGAANEAVALVATVSPEFTSKVQAGKLIQTIAPIVGGKGGGRPDNARGGGKEVAKLDEALAKAKSLLSS